MPGLFFLASHCQNSTLSHLDYIPNTKTIAPLLAKFPTFLTTVSSCITVDVGSTVLWEVGHLFSFLLSISCNWHVLKKTDMSFTSCTFVINREKTVALWLKYIYVTHFTVRLLLDNRRNNRFHFPSVNTKDTDRMYVCPIVFFFCFFIIIQAGNTKRARKTATKTGWPFRNTG